MSESLQTLVDRQQIDRRGTAIGYVSVERNLDPGVPLLSPSLARLLHEHLPHHPRDNAQKVNPAFKGGWRLREEPQIGLIDECCRLQRHRGPPGAELFGRQPAQLVK